MTKTAKPKAAYRCSECGWSTPKWVGRCGECQAWGSVSEAGSAHHIRTTPSAVTEPALAITDVVSGGTRHAPTGVAEFDRVLGGGIVPGSVVLMAGEPGVGKSTLLLDVAAHVAALGHSVLYVTGEESAGQVRMRAERIGALHPGLKLAAETDLGAVLTHIERTAPVLLICDSVQTIGSAVVDGTPGNTSQIREVAGALIRAAKSRSMATLLVGHVTKDGSIAGPRLLEHLVDVVCQFEGDRHSRLRMVRAVKNRFGPTDEVGCFELTDTGISGLADPSGLFMSHNATAPGSCIAVTVEGRRPLAVEIQSLVTAAAGQNPRRTTHGVDGSRVSMVAAVLTQRLRLPFGNKDVFVSTVGGAKVSEPATDLAVAISLASAITDRAVPARTVAFGEVSLSGDVRPVTAIPRRVAEAARLGCQRAIVPASVVDEIPTEASSSIEVVPVPHIMAALQAALPSAAS